MSPSRRKYPRLACLAALLLAAGAARAQIAPLAGLALTDHRQQRLTAQTLGGAPVLLHFVFTGCSSTCPLQLHELVALRAALPASVRQRVRFVSVTVDPLNDTPATLARFATRMGADQPGWQFVTGTPGEVGRLTERMAAFDSRRTNAPAPADHRTALWLYDARGVLVQRYAGWPIDRPRLIDDIRRIAS